MKSWWHCTLSLLSSMERPLLLWPGLALPGLLLLLLLLLLLARSYSATHVRRLAAVTNGNSRKYLKQKKKVPRS